MHKMYEFNWPPCQGHHDPRRANSAAAPGTENNFSDSEDKIKETWRRGRERDSQTHFLFIQLNQLFI